MTPLLLLINFMVAVFFQWVDDMADAGADQYTFHIEATGNELLQQMKIKNVII